MTSPTQPPIVSPSWLKRVAATVLLTPIFMLFPLWLPLFDPPSIPGALAEHWDLYLLFVGLPFALSMALWFIACRIEGASKAQ